MSLKERLKAQIAATGPLTVAQYMTACLFDPEGGYYATRPRLGADGDFITAPMVSQMFGELLGLWAAQAWSGLGSPAPVRLVEVGPGDGTLMLDALRAARAAPGFLDAIELVLVEVSEPLRAMQAERLADAPVKPRWIANLSELPEGPPVILIANEVLDCLPARQFMVTGEGWSERVVGLNHKGDLTFGALPPRGGEERSAKPSDRQRFVDRSDERRSVSDGRAGWVGGGPAEPTQMAQVGAAPIGDRPRSAPDAPPPLPLPPREGGIVEVSAAQQAFGAVVGEMVKRDTGAALLIDYGRDAPGYGDTLQALKCHHKVDPLASPGEADLTVHADFPAVLAAAREAGAAATPILAQGNFLRRLGIDQRAAALARARPDKTETISRQLQRLVGDREMGRLFKAAAIHWPASPVPPGFEQAFEEA